MTTEHPEIPLPMSDADWADRLDRSCRALRSWNHEANLPWVDRDLTRSIAETEIAVLQNLMLQMPADLCAEAQSLVHDWDELRLTLFET